MKLKRLYTAAFLTLALALVLVLAALPFLPDSIPAHYNAMGQVNRWGSKYETLIFPVLILPYGAFYLGTCRLARGFSSGKTAEPMLLIGGIVQFVIFDVMILYFLYADFRQVENLAFLSLDLHQLLCAGAGVILIALGNWMPKLQKPGPVGLRTPWSMKNEAVWRRCQRFGGWSFAAAGLFTIATAVLSHGAYCWLWMILALTVAGIAGVVYSWHAAKTTQNK